MEDFKEVAREYAKATQSVKQAREKLIIAIIKYIIANGHDWGKCTELSVSEGLGIPRSAARSVLLDLVDEGILEVRDAGNIKPYVLGTIGAAIDYLGLGFSRNEMRELFSVREDKLEGMWAVSYNVQLEVDGRWTNRYRGIAADECFKVLIGRFLDCADYVDNKWETINSKVEKAFGKQTLIDLNYLIPETGSLEKIVAIWPFPAQWMNRNLQFIDEKTPVEDVKKTVIHTYEMFLDYAIGRLRTFASVLEERGYEGLHALLKGKQPHHSTITGGGRPEPDWKFHDEYLWATTLALRDSCRIGEKIGADLKRLDEARTLADVLDIALERKYAGAKAEGLGLMDWGLRQLSKESK